MQCPRCQAKNRAGRRFCAECGAVLALPCSACGFSNEPGEKFCGGCGTPLTTAPQAPAPRLSAPQAHTPSYLAEKILTTKSTLEGERKQVTVLFADLKGSMELLADRDPEEARQLLDPVVEHMMAAVHRYEGTVNQVMGDGIMALFGAPIAHEDHAVRACYAALRMQEAVKQYAEEVFRRAGLRVQIRVGLNSGEVVVRSIGSDLRMDYTAVGQTTHLAARMEQTALPGTILLAPDTLRLAEGYVQVRALGPIPIKGLAVPVEVYEVVGAGLTRTRLQAAAARGLTRFVGRDTEFAMLRQSLGQAGAGHGQVVALVGEPGVGKSRLVYEFLHAHHTQGNPFFLEESVRTLVETGVLIGNRGAYRLAQPLDTLQVPATVQALLAARIDRLSPEDKRLLQTAAVIGTEVPWPLLQAIADASDEALYHSLAQLQAAEFLYETSLFPERAYTFKHALTHEVAYAGLLHERRRVLHARIVEALAALAGDRLDDQVERLAQHALRGGVWEKSLAYGRQAGDKAWTRSAYREAVAYYEQALAALAHLPDSRATTEQAIDLRLGLRTMHTVLGEAPGRLFDHLRSAETLAQTLGDHLRLGRVYAEMGATFWGMADVDRAIDYGQRALALAATLGDVGLQAWAHLSLGRIYYDAGDYPRAVESLGWNVATLQGELLSARFGTNGSVAAISRAWLSLCHAELGTFTEGLAMAEDGLRIAEAINNLFSLIQPCYGVSMVYLSQGDVHRAIPVLERAMGLCQDWHIPVFVPVLAAALGVAYTLEGRGSTGLARVEHEVEQEAAMPGSRRLALMVACLSEAYLLAGRLEDARQRAAQACDLAHQCKQRGQQAWALWLLGESTTRQASSEVEPAAGHYREALALAETLGMRPLQAHCHRGFGTLYATTGLVEQARIELSIAIEMYCAMEMTFWLPQAEAALARVEDR